MARKSPFKEITNVGVLFLLSVRPLIGTEEELRATIVIFSTETYDEGVWSALRTSCGGILCVAMHLSMSVKRLVCTIRIFLKAQEVLWFQLAWKNYTVDKLIWPTLRLAQIPWSLSRDSLYQCQGWGFDNTKIHKTTSVSYSHWKWYQFLVKIKKNGRATTSAVWNSCIPPCLFVSFNYFWYACLKVLTVLSVRFGSCALKWFMALRFPFSLAYLLVFARIFGE